MSGVILFGKARAIFDHLSNLAQTDGEMTVEDMAARKKEEEEAFLKLTAPPPDPSIN